MIGRRRFVDVVRRQLDLFVAENRELVRACEAAEASYDRAPREQAEERYGDLLDLVETGTELLADARDAYARTLDDEAAEEYERTFNRAVARSLPRFAPGLDVPER